MLNFYKNQKESEKQTNYKKVKCCFNCDNSRTLRQDGSCFCLENIINENTRHAQYMSINSNGLCDNWKEK